MLSPQVSITFSGNTAITGPAIYANQLDLCSWYTNRPPYFNDTSQVLRWPIISYKYVSACLTIVLVGIHQHKEWCSNFIVIHLKKAIKVVIVLLYIRS